MDYVTTVTSKGQVTIPATIRKALGLKPRDKVSFRLEDNSVRILPAKSSVDAAYGAAKLRRSFRNLKQLRSETREWVTKRALREL